MCTSPTKSIVWDKQPSGRVLVGQIIDGSGEEHYILQSEGKDMKKPGTHYALWYPLGKGKQLLIDEVVQTNKGWKYTRKYQCKDWTCITKKFLKKVNPQFSPV